MNKFIMDVELPDGAEKEIELDVSSLGDIDSYDSADLKEEIKYLIKKQYPELWPIRKIWMWIWRASALLFFISVRSNKEE